MVRPPGTKLMQERLKLTLALLSRLWAGRRSIFIRTPSRRNEAGAFRGKWPILVTSLCLAAVAPTAADLAGQNIVSIKALRAGACSSERLSLLGELESLPAFPIIRAGEARTSLLIGPEERITVPLHGKAGRSGPWTPWRGAVSFWVMPLAKPRAGTTGEHMYLSANGAVLQLYATHNALQFLVGGPDPVNSYHVIGRIDPGELSLGSWHHIAATWDWAAPEAWALALDGRVLARGRLKAGEPASPGTVSTLGLGYYVPTGALQSVGLLDHLAIYSQPEALPELALSAQTGVPAMEPASTRLLLFSTEEDDCFQTQLNHPRRGV